MVIEVRTLGVKECIEEGCGLKPYARSLCKKHHQWKWKRGMLPERNMLSLKERILAYSEPVTESGCWLWLRGISTQGYGCVAGGNGIRRYAHRVAYEQFVGPIGEGLEVCHKCDTPSCCNPEHLFLGTHKENMQDSSRKGRARNRPFYGLDHPRAALTADRLAIIRQSSKSPKELANEFGCNVETIRRAKRGDTYAKTD